VDTNDHGALNPESEDGIAGNVDGAAPNFSTLDRADDRANDAVILFRFDPIRVGLYGVSLAVHIHRFQIQFQVVIRGDANDQFHSGPARNRHASSFPAHVLIDGAPVNTGIPAIHVNRLVSADRDRCARLNPGNPVSIMIPIPVAVSIAILGYGGAA
jgi:hypothetical protein